MSELPPLLRDQRKIDADHLKLLAIFHFVGAGLAGLGILFLFAHYAMMQVFFANPEMWQGKHGEGPPPGFFDLFKWFYLVFGLWLVVSTGLNVISGLWIRARKHRTFSLVVAGLNCVNMPLGTGLGVFTIVVLVRSSVRELYEHEQPQP